MPPIPGRIFPIDPTLGPDDAAYRYGVVVRVECGSVHTETLIFVDTETIVLGIDAIDMAIESWASDLHQGPYSPPPIPGADARCSFSGRIVSVGRRSDVPMFPER